MYALFSLILPNLNPLSQSRALLIVIFFELNLLKLSGSYNKETSSEKEIPYLFR